MKKALIIKNLSNKESLSLSEQLSLFLKTKGYSSDSLNFDGVNQEFSFKKYDFVITLGGDGTVLFAARNCLNYGIPIFPINLGQFGFMASVQPSEWQENLELFLSGNAPSQLRSMLYAELYRDGKMITSGLGLNDVVFSARHTVRTVAMDVSFNDAHLCRLRGDGLIISSATGSTAYSASAGGPIVDPVLDAFVMTPINSFSLSGRPIVLRPEGSFQITIQPCRTKEIRMHVDGQEVASLNAGDIIKIRLHERKIKLICSTQNKFFNALQSKLNWQGEPYA